MSLDACIPGLVADHKITKEQGERARAAYERHYRRLAGTMAPEAAAAEASRAALDEIARESALKKRQTLLQAAKQGELGKQADRVGHFKAFMGRMEWVDKQRHAILGRAHAMMTDILFKHSRNLIGEVRDKTGLTDLVRELFGHDTGNSSARELAQAWRQASEYLRQRFNRAGGAIARLMDWGLPQSHDMMKVRAAGFNAWRDFVLPLLDLARMRDERSGLPFTPDTIENALRDVWESIRTDGWNKREAGTGGVGKIANRHTDARFLVFKDADSWMAYQDRFGTGNAFDTMMGHMEMMSRQIALMEGLGPNPPATLRWMQDSVMKATALGDETKVSAFDRARGLDKALGDIYGVVSGQLNSPVNETWARRMAGVRNFLTSALLGSASLTALTDVGFQAVTRAYNGLPLAGAVTGYLKLLNPLARGDRRLAVRLGLIAEEASHRAASLARYIDASHGPEVMMRLSDAVLRLSGAQAWWQAGKWAFGMELLGHLADVRGKDYAGLSSPIRDMLGRYGIDAAGWDAIRATDTYKHSGLIGTAEFLRPDDVKDEALGDAMLRMVLSETNFAVPTVTARARAMMNFGTRPGTLAGEIVRNTGLFKSFGVSMVLNHGARMMSEGPANRAAYFAALVSTSAMLGYVANSAYAIVNGKDIPDPRAPSTWAKAELKGGGAGIYGDFLGSSVNRFGGGLAETMAGPVVSLASDVSGAVARPIADSLDPAKRANPGKEAVGLLKRYTPGGSLWYGRLAFQRYLIDFLSEHADPTYPQSWSRMREKAQTEGQPYWWAPGQNAPERAPTAGEVR